MVPDREGGAVWLVNLASPTRVKKRRKMRYTPGNRRIILTI